MFSRGVTLFLGQFRRSLVLGWDYHWKSRSSNWLPRHHRLWDIATALRRHGHHRTLGALGDRTATCPADGDLTNGDFTKNGDLLVRFK